MAAPSKVSTPAMLDLTSDNITPNAITINSQSANPRATYLMERLITHLHDFARETRISTEEWMTALDFLVECGQISTAIRHEFILLSDVLGLSLLVENINHPKPPGATEGTVLGPFHRHDAPTLDLGANISSDPNGEPLLCVCTVKDMAGKPLEGVMVDIWETDSSGHYDVQHENRTEPDGRCVISSNANGDFWFNCILPVSYPVPTDGPVGNLLRSMNRHAFRPAHMHFMLKKQGWDPLTTALYIRGDPYETTDAVFGVKKSLIVSPQKIDKATAKQYGVPENSWILKQDFILPTEKESADLKDQLAMKAIEKMGLNMKLVDHLPVPDLD
ncbi:dioxygenase [Xylaria intraflava]|nr:dioxygenase [Xylaria intraflava]